ncbi:MAG: T9SS type A sorting domain-containing protein [Bacteroidia bacterium]|nr:T9SS type A sorting domain-containing protein [Bacteroidia bacterium]
MKIKLLIVIFLLPFFAFTQSIKIGQGSYGGTNIYGPMYTTTLYDTAFSTHAFIYKKSLLSGLNHGDSISSFTFYAVADNPAKGYMNLKIYIKMTDNDTFGASNLNWTNEKNSSGVVLVYDDNPSSMLNGVSEYKTFVFNKNIFKYDTSGSKHNLEILFSYTQHNKQTTNTYWVYESNFTVPEFKSRNEGKYNFGVGKAPDTTRFSDVRKPHIIINFPRYTNNLEVLKTYCLGQVPLLANISDSIKVLIGNRGKKTVFQSKLFLKITGANTHFDTLNLDTIIPWKDKIYSFAKFKPDSSGEDNVLIELKNDDFNGNNFDTIKRLVNYNIFSHADPFIGNAGGIGFNGATGDFVAKFFSDTGNFINQVSVDFSSSGRGFRVGIWDDNGTGGMPGKVLFMSDSLISKAGSYILPVSPKVKVGGGFYVGIRQNTFTNVAFSYQEEDPVRPGAFYFTEPMGNTTWTPFSPGFPYKFNIQPRIQADNDIAPIEIVFPKSNQVIDYSVRDSIGPIVKVTNFGVNDQNTPFEVICKIDNIYGINEYTSIKKITLKSEETKTLYFDTLFRLYNIGEHKIKVTCKLKNDKITDNDELSHLFKIAVKHDIACDIMYSPDENSIFEYNKDTIYPTVRINNNGIISKNNFKVTFRIKNDTSVVYEHTLIKSLIANEQDIISFKKFVPKVVGIYTAECFVTIKDSIPYNDTIRHIVEFQKSNDVSPMKIDNPLSTSLYAMGAIILPRATIINYGLKTQIVPFKTNIKIYDPTGTLVYEDTLSTQLGGYSQTQLTYKKFVIPMKYGRYFILANTLLNEDQEKSNDSLISYFIVLPNKDFSVKKIIIPANDTVISIESKPLVPVIKIKNEGSQTISNPGFFLFEIYKKNIKIYEDSANATGNISYNTSINVNFSKQAFFNETGEYMCRVTNKLNGDIKSANDTIYSKFRVTRNYDIAIDTLGNISKEQVFTYENKFFKPQILIKNFGSISYPDSINVELKLYKNGFLFKTFNKIFDSLSKFESYSWLQDSFISLRQVGDFVFKVNIKANLDQNNTNDSAMWKFSIVKPYDLTLDSITFPDKYNYCYNNKIYRPRLKVSNKGLVPIVNTSINFRVYETTNIIWQQSIDIDLGKDESKWLVFDSTLKFDFTGGAWARAVGYLSNDNEKNNDTLILSFNVDFTSGINNSSVDKNYKIYPNPTDGIINFEFEEQNNSIYIYNTKSQLIYVKTNINSKNIKLDLINDIKLKGGVYFIRIQNPKGNFISKLILY